MNVTEIRDGKDGESICCWSSLCMIFKAYRRYTACGSRQQLSALKMLLRSLTSRGNIITVRSRGKIYYMPRDGEDLTKTPVYMPNLEVITDVRGSDF